MPKISVIVPVYGVEQFIERCARSLFEQTLCDIEYIFIDDCTPDQSIRILNDIIEEYKQRLLADNKIVRVEKMSSNSGLPSVRKYGIKLATGDYIVHCDSDDWVDISMYEKLYTLAKNDNSDIVFCHYYLSDGVTHTPCNDNQRKLMSGPLWNKLIKRSLYDKIDEYPVCNKAEDGAYMVQLSFFAVKVSLLQEYLYYYFQNPSSICGNVSEKACLSKVRQEYENTELRIRFLERYNSLSKYRTEIIRWKKYTRDNLLPVIGDYKCYKIWRKTYPELNYQYLFNREIKLKEKLLFVLYLLRIKR